MDKTDDITNPMSSKERLACISLASIFACRMLGLFMLLPVLSLFAGELDESTPFLIGLAISAYGLTQALFQIPFGMLSDRYGRKKIIAIGLLLFAAGSIVAALSESIYGVILGRALQGSGAVAAAVMALAADLTREVHRTKAMATIGISIGTSFAISVVLGPLIAGAFGLHSIFWVTTALALLAVVILFTIVPTPTDSHFHRDTGSVPSQFKTVLGNTELLRLDFGILILHIILTALFITLPLVLRDTSLAVESHWQVYLPVLIVSMLAIVPFIIIAEKKRKMKPVFTGAIAAIAVACFGLYFFHNSLTGIVIFLLIFFGGFNLLEATLPSLISKAAPASLKGTAMGVYSSSQFFGAFLGGLCGGWIYGSMGMLYVFIFCGLCAVLWLLVALTMSPPKHLSSLLVSVGKLDQQQAQQMSEKIGQIKGVAEAMVSADEGVAYLKVDKNILDQDHLQSLIPATTEQ